MKLLFCKPEMIKYWQFHVPQPNRKKTLLDIHQNANCGSVIDDFKNNFTVCAFYE